MKKNIISAVLSATLVILSFNSVFAENQQSDVVETDMQKSGRPQNVIVNKEDTYQPEKEIAEKTEQNSSSDTSQTVVEEINDTTEEVNDDKNGFVNVEAVPEEVPPENVSDDPGYVYLKDIPVGKYTIVASKKENPGLYYDITAYRHTNGYEFLLPFNTNPAGINIEIYNSKNESVFKGKVDFTDDNPDVFELSEESFVLTATHSTLPVLYLDIDEKYGSIDGMNSSPDHSTYTYGDMTMYVPDELAKKYDCDTEITSVGKDSKADRPGTVRMSGRGNSTWDTYTDRQRPYKLKLEKGLNILGMGKTKDWALLRSESGKQYIRNKICFDMAADFGMKFSPRARMTDVYMNGQYIGMYTMTTTIEIDEESVNIADIEKDIEDGKSFDSIDTTGGYLLEIDNNTEWLQFDIHQNLITVKSPENLDVSVADGSRYDYIKNIMTEVLGAVYGNGIMSDGRHFSEVLDLDSCVRFFLLQELTGNFDCGRGSLYLYKDTDSVDSKIYMGPAWDSDSTFTYEDNAWTMYLKKRTYADLPDVNYTFLHELCEHKEFMGLIKAYYYDNLNNNNIRTTYLSYADKVPEYKALYSESAAATSRRYGLTAPDFDYIADYIRTKGAFADENLIELVQWADFGKSSEHKNHELFINSGEEFITVLKENNRIYYSFENNSIYTKPAILLAYDADGKLINASRTFILPPYTKRHGNMKFDLPLENYKFKTYYDGTYRWLKINE